MKSTIPRAKAKIMLWLSTVYTEAPYGGDCRAGPATIYGAPQRAPLSVFQFMNTTTEGLFVDNAI